VHSAMHTHTNRPNSSLDWVLSHWAHFTVLRFIFTARRSYASAVLGVVILSVRPSVCHTRALWLIQRTYWRYFYTAWKSNPSSFLPPNSGWWATTPSTFNGWSKWPTPFKNRSRRQISACNVSIVSASEKSSIVTNRKSYTGFPTSYRWSAYVTSKSPKRWLKKRTFPLFE